MIAALCEDWLRNRVFCDPHKDLKIGHFCKYCDHGRSPNKEDCDHGLNYIKTQKYDIFVRNVIMIAVLINSAFHKECDHDRNPQKYGCDHFVRIEIIIVVLINKKFL